MRLEEAANELDLLLEVCGNIDSVSSCLALPGTTQQVLLRAGTKDLCLQEAQLNNVPLLVFANKQDLPGSLQPSEIAEGLSLFALRTRAWQIEGTGSDEFWCLWTCVGTQSWSGS